MNMNLHVMSRFARGIFLTTLFLMILIAVGMPVHAESVPADEFLGDWLVLGPVPVFPGPADAEDDDAQRSAFESNAINPDGLSVTEGQRRRLKDMEFTWSKIARQTLGMTDLTQLDGETDFSIAYAWTQIDAPATTNLLLGVGSDDAVKMWVNGEAVHTRWVRRPLTVDEDLVPIRLSEGPNTILLKIQNRQWAWAFHESGETFLTLIQGGAQHDAIRR